MNGLYEHQRAMRAMRRAAMTRGVAAILDIGTTKISCLILRFDGPDDQNGMDGVGAMAGQSNLGVFYTEGRGRRTWRRRGGG